MAGCMVGFLQDNTQREEVNVMNEQNIENEPQEERIGQVPETAPAPPGSRDADTSDVPPPMTIAGRGPMDQNTPDVATGSTPVTRRDD